MIDTTKAFVFAALVAVVATAASAQDSKVSLTGEEFLSACSKADPEWIGFCHGYVQAVVDGVLVPGEKLCFPSGLTRASIVGVVVKSLTATPELRQLNAASVVYGVLSKTYPCQ